MPSILISAAVLLLATPPVSSEQEEHPRVRLPMYRHRQHYSTSNGFGTLTTTEGTSTDWYAKLSLGTPAQNFTVLLDTGSEALWVTGTGCSGNPFCGNCPVYDSNKSSTYVKNGTKFHYPYGAGTAVGTLGQETVTLGPFEDGLIATNLTFAEVTQIKRFTNQGPLFCGILGLSFANMSAGTQGKVGHGAKTLVEVLAEQHPTIEAKFAFHLPKNPVPAYPFTPETGEFVVGKVDPTAFRGKLVAAPVKLFQLNVSNHLIPLHEWSVEMTFTVDGVSGRGNTVIDSGSEGFAGLLPPVYEAVTRKTGLLPTCDEVVQKGPTMTVSVAGADFDFTGADYAFGGWPNTCLGVAPQSFFGFGNDFLRVVYTVFDVKQRTVSFAYATHSKNM